MAALSQKKTRWLRAMDRINAGRHHRYLLFLAGDVVIIIGALVGALVVASGGAPRDAYGGHIWLLVAAALAAKIISLHWFRLYSITWGYVSTRDLVAVIRAVTVSSLGLAIGVMTANWLVGRPLTPPNMPLSTLLVVDYLLTLVLLGGFRSAKRLAREMLHRGHGESLRRVLIAGAGDAGEQVARRLREEDAAQHEAVGFVDDALAKQGATLHGVPVLGTRQDIPKLVDRLGVDELWIAMPSCSGSVVREVVELGRQSGLQHIKIVPGLGTLLSGQVRLTDLRQVQLEDLLDRKKVRIDTRQVAGRLENKLILVTGAAGSIGAELCEQISKFGPKGIALLDQDESRLFDLQNHLSFQFPHIQTHAIVGDVCDGPKMDRVFQNFRPAVVFHAAAYKHVPLMEVQPGEAIRTNVIGTRVIGQAALRWGAEQFVLISTDKAVNPTSVMGATKRVAETVICDLNRAQETRFIAVRFGNVLGSRGSVVLTFQAQIARGGPVTVTDPEMKRYFMTIDEAAMLVLQAAAIDEGGAVLVLDMGEPVKIMDLARQLIRLSGLEPDQDIPIVVTGARPGEKLFEDLLTAEEGVTSTSHERVFVARMNGILHGRNLETCLEQLDQAVLQDSRGQMVAALRTIVPTYQPDIRFQETNGAPSNSGERDLRAGPLAHPETRSLAFSSQEVDESGRS